MEKVFVKIYLAKSNKCNPETLINTRAIIEKHGECIEYKGGDWNAHKHLIKECELLVLIPHPQTGDDMFIGKGLYTTLDDFTARFNDKWCSSVILALESPEIGFISFHKVVGYRLSDSENWSMKYGLIAYEVNGHEFQWFIGESLTLPEIQQEIYHDNNGDKL